MKNTTTTSKFPLPKDKGWVRLPERVEKLESSLSDSIRPYKVYTALLTQSGTDAPVATVLENTLGSITFSRTDIGKYGIISNQLFTINKTAILSGSEYIFNPTLVSSSVSDSSLIEMSTVDVTGVNNYSDDILASNLIEIRVYN